MTSVTEDYVFDESLGRYAYSFTLGLKEIMFLLIIFSFGFLGFSLCIEKVYATQNEDKINNVMIHDVEISSSQKDLSSTLLTAKFPKS